MTRFIAELNGGDHINIQADRMEMDQVMSQTTSGKMAQETIWQNFEPSGQLRMEEQCEICAYQH